jgi:hypothetical protein
VTIASAECCFPLISKGNSQEVELGVEVDLGKLGSFLEAVKKFISQRKGIAILDRG